MLSSYKKLFLRMLVVVIAMYSIDGTMHAMVDEPIEITDAEVDAEGIINDDAADLPKDLAEDDFGYSDDEINSLIAEGENIDPAATDELGVDIPADDMEVVEDPAPLSVSGLTGTVTNVTKNIAGTVASTASAAAGQAAQMATQMVSSKMTEMMQDPTKILENAAAAKAVAAKAAAATAAAAAKAKAAAQEFMDNRTLASAESAEEDVKKAEQKIIDTKKALAEKQKLEKDAPAALTKAQAAAKDADAQVAPAKAKYDELKPKADAAKKAYDAVKPSVLPFSTPKVPASCKALNDAYLAAKAKSDAALKAYNAIKPGILAKKPTADQQKKIDAAKATSDAATAVTRAAKTKLDAEMNKGVKVAKKAFDTADKAAKDAKKIYDDAVKLQKTTKDAVTKAEKAVKTSADDVVKAQKAANDAETSLVKKKADLEKAKAAAEKVREKLKAAAAKDAEPVASDPETAAAATE